MLAIYCRAAYTTTTMHEMFEWPPTAPDAIGQYFDALTQAETPRDIVMPLVAAWEFAEVETVDEDYMRRLTGADMDDALPLDGRQKLCLYSLLHLLPVVESDTDRRTADYYAAGFGALVGLTAESHAGGSSQADDLHADRCASVIQNCGPATMSDLECPRVVAARTLLADIRLPRSHWNGLEYQPALRQTRPVIMSARLTGAVGGGLIPPEAARLMRNNYLDRVIAREAIDLAQY